MTAGPRLHGVRHLGAVTAAGALAWFAADRSGGPARGAVTGYLLAADRAAWFRCDGADPVPRGPDAARDISGAFEVYASDGDCQLRWLHDAAGAGAAVALGEDPARLPGGEIIACGRERFRLPGVASRLLAGRVIRVADEWAMLASARYESCDVPVAAAAGDEVWAQRAEYAVSDEHGNLSVADTLLLALESRPPPGAKEGER